mmetsp:Transcript_24222/g.52246  ORF Transcript_24222/g.52246 Transcript_24222/m.52246 type:complete len:107 (+) Transcript_24222:719-1039(+)
MGTGNTRVAVRRDPKVKDFWSTSRRLWLSVEVSASLFGFANSDGSLVRVAIAGVKEKTVVKSALRWKNITSDTKPADGRDEVWSVMVMDSTSAGLAGKERAVRAVV